ncbi:MAG: type III pantothenate kinase [Lachnospiraceae bacterium]|nr:type III pantothenate kinase [Lachnospiraceae bacterium]
MILAIDVGNTNITLGTFNKSRLRRIFRVTTKTPRTSDEYGILLTDIIRLSEASVSDIDGVIIASVVPSVMYSLVNGCSKYLHIRPLIVGPGMKTGVRVHSDNPKDTGADLIANAAAVKEIYGGPAIVVDYETSTSYELVLEDGTLYSVILTPGIQTSLTALTSEASRIMEVEIKKPRTKLPHETTECIQAGIVYGTIGETEYIVKMMKEEAGLGDIKVVATGGFGRVIAKETSVIDTFDPLLTLHGLRIIYQKSRSEKA